MPTADGSHGRHSQPSAATSAPRGAIGRLTAAADFAHVYQDGQSYSSKLLRMHCASGESGRTRVAYVAGRRVGAAVSCNRAKRLMREASRELLSAVEPARDIIFVAHRSLPEARTSDARTAMVRLMRRAGLTGERQ